MPYAPGCRPSRATGKPPGRPLKAAADAAAALVAAGSALPEDAARAAKVGRSTLYRRLAAAPASAPSPAVAPAAPLSRPAEPAAAGPRDNDPLVTLARAQESLEADLAKPATVDAAALKVRLALGLVAVAKAHEAIRLGRPRVETEDERQARFHEDRDAVLRRIRTKLPELLAARTAG